MILKEIAWNDEGTYYTRGHVDLGEFAAAMASEVAADTAQVETESRHLWGRWVPSRGEYDMRLHVVGGPARGAFAFTLWDPTSRINAERVAAALAYREQRQTRHDFWVNGGAT